MASSSSSAQGRSIVSPKLYDVFISHRGPDVKETLAKQLYEGLQERRCRAFLDRKELEGGDSIPSAIHNAICSSRVQIAIFSKRYAESSWCLDELVLMLKQQPDALFIPVFYKVHPSELRHIENTKSQYAAAFCNYQSKGRNLDNLDEWKTALASAADISGYELTQNQDDICDKIVSRVEKEMKKWIPLHVATYLVGLAELVQDLERFCSKRARDKATNIVGILGLGGAGKTTLAKEFFNRKCSDYDGSCFLSDIRESHARGNLHCLQSQLVDDLFEEKQLFKNVDDGIAHLKYRLERATHLHLHFLIVLDDIDNQQQLDALLPERMLSAGSLVIITTRDQNMLRVADVSSRYRMKGLDKDQSKELFCRHAFRGRNRPIAYEKLIERFVDFCGGLPLSLMVLGAQLYGRNEGYWELQLAKVKNIPTTDIMQKLKISFDGLDRQEQQIFIDIACFFNKKTNLFLKRKAISVWNASGWSAEIAVQNLQDKSLVEIDNRGRFKMHDHLRDLGRRIADESGPPRLWRPELLRPLEANGLQQILAQTKVRCFLDKFKDSQIQATISCFIGSVNDSIEPKLLWLEISPMDDSLKSIPSWIPLRKLLYLSVYPMEELWSTFQQQTQTNTQASFDLRSLQISESPSLQKLPDLIRMLSHLEELFTYNSLQKTDPTSLVQSLKQLSNLSSLKLWQEDGGLFSGNLNLSKGRAPNNFEASTSIRMDNLKTISLRHLRNISELVISGDVCPRLRSLDVRSMENLNEMDLKELVRLNTIEVLNCPLLKRISGLYTLTGLQSLEVWNCSTLETVSGLSSLTGLQSLKVGKCPKLETLSELSSLTELQMFETEECGELKWLTSIAHQRHLERIKISHCQQLQNVQGFEELQGLKSLIIEVPDTTYRYEWVRNCIYGLRSLPSECTVVVGKPVDDASFGLNVNLFSEVIGIQTVVEITGGEYMLYLRGSSSAITIYALLVEASFHDKDDPYLHPYTTDVYYTGGTSFPSGCEWMLTVIQAPHVTDGMLKNVRISKGIKATVNEGEEEKALDLLQRIFDRLYR